MLDTAVSGVSAKNRVIQNEDTQQIIKSTCGICQIGCGILVHLINGEVVKIEGDPESVLNKGVICPKGKATLEYLNHPNRLLRPLKRMGKRGGGKWQPIEWDEALNTVARELANTRDQYGAESVAFLRGASKGLQDDYLTKFANIFGSPNITSMAHICFIPRRNASLITYGFYAIPDFGFSPECILVWGANLYENLHHVYYRVENAQKNGAKLIVVDPRKIKEAEAAELWLRLSPGSDLALVLGMLHVIINEGLYDKNFVEQWTLGFSELQKHVQDYPPSKVADITWLPAEAIIQAARIYATSKSSCIQWGNSIDQGINSFQTARALCILRAITGNLEVPGGELKWGKIPLLERGSPTFNLQNNISPAMRERRITADEKLIPMAFYALPQGIFKAILDGDPYFIRSAYIHGCNSLLSYSNAKNVYKALNKLNFLAVSDMFMTPTAALADIVLPVATFLEFNSIVTPPYSLPVASIQQRVTRIGECRSDFEIMSGLAQRLGYGEHFKDSEEEVLDHILKPAGLTFDEFRKIGALIGTKQYRTYKTEGFNTSSGKVELYSKQLEEWGFDPLPVYYEPPDNASAHASEYPLIMTSGKSLYYRHSGGRQIASLRNMCPQPITYVNTQTAEKLNINNGDWIYIETLRGKIKQRAILADDLDPKVVWINPCWWFPEKEAVNLYGWEKSNINILTNDSPPFNKEMGSVNLRGLRCKIYKA